MGYNRLQGNLEKPVSKYKDKEEYIQNKGYVEFCKQSENKVFEFYKGGPVYLFCPLKNLEIKKQK